MNGTGEQVHFNLNEWFIVTSLILSAALVIWLPRRFSNKTTAVFLLCGVFFGFLFDHTLSVFPVSFYTVNDTPWFEVMDFLSHVMYAAYSYLFFYLYSKLEIKLHAAPLYVLIWVFISVGFEKLCETIGIFRYENGYSIYYSFVIYLLVTSFWIYFYKVIMAHGEKRF